jgi:hypothetical protein
LGLFSGIKRDNNGNSPTAIAVIVSFYSRKQGRTCPKGGSRFLLFRFRKTSGIRVFSIWTDNNFELWIPNCALRVIEEGGNAFAEGPAQGTGETPHGSVCVPESHC